MSFNVKLQNHVRTITTVYGSYIDVKYSMKVGTIRYFYKQNITETLLLLS